MKSRIYLLTMILFSIIFSLTIVNSQNIDYEGTIYEDIPDYCVVDRVQSGAYDTFRAMTTFTDIYTNLTQQALESEFNTDFSYTFRDFESGIDLKVNFIGEGSNENILGEYINSTKEINIYLKNIYDFTTLNFNSTEDYYNRSLLTFKHELFHYYDSHFNGFDNLTTKENIYNMEHVFNSSENQYVLSNQQYYENISGTGNQSLIYSQPFVPAVYRSAVNFEFVFADYNLVYHSDEVTARIGALCLREQDNFDWSFLVGSNYAFCEEFNLRESDADEFQKITDEITEQYFYENYPEYVLEPIVLSNEQCESYSQRVETIKTTRAMYDLLGFIVDNVTSIMISLMALLILGIFIRFPSLFNHIIKKILNR